MYKRQIQNKVIRKKAQWVYKFTENNQGKIDMWHMTYYQLHNVGHETAKNPVEMTLASYGSEKYKVDLAKCVSSDGKTILVNYNREDPSSNRGVDVSEFANKVHIKYTIDIPPDDYVEYTTVYRKAFDTEVSDACFTKTSIIEAELIANYPEGYVFNVFPSFSSRLRPIDEGMSGTHQVYKLDGVALPYQGFFFSLIKKTQ